jgi:hypothetical protein
MAVEYNGIKIGDEDPFVGISNEMVVYGGKRCAIKRITVQGKIIGNSTLKTSECPPQKTIVVQIKDFADMVTEDYKEFSAGSFKATYARCESLNVTNSNSFGAEYSAEFLAYPDEWFTDIVGVLDPTDSVKIIQNRDKTISITRSVSGRGVRNDDNATKRVYDWITSLNLHLITDPKITSLADVKSIDINISAQPLRMSQNFNRLDGTVTAEVEFKFNENSTSKTLLNISTDISYDAKIGGYVVTLNGTLSGAIGYTINDLKTEFLTINPFIFANSQLPSGAPPLDTTPVSANIDLDEQNISINFTYVYNTLIGDQLIKSTTTVEYDLLKDIKTIALQGTAVLNKKTQSEKILKKNDLLKDTVFSDIAKSEYTKYLVGAGGDNSSQSQTLLAVHPKSYSASLNETDLTLSYNVSYDNSTIIDSELALPPEVYSFNYQINYIPSIDMKLPLQFIPGNQGIMDLKAKRRGSLSINGTALATKIDLESKILKSAQLLLDSIATSESFMNKHFEQKICNYYKDADNTFKYSFEISVTAETKNYSVTS